MLIFTKKNNSNQEPLQTRVRNFKVFIKTSPFPLLMKFSQTDERTSVGVTKLASNKEHFDRLFQNNIESFVTKGLFCEHGWYSPYVIEKVVFDDEDILFSVDTD